MFTTGKRYDFRPLPLFVGLFQGRFVCAVMFFVSFDFDGTSLQGLSVSNTGTDLTGSYRGANSYCELVGPDVAFVPGRMSVSDRWRQEYAFPDTRKWLSCVAFIPHGRIVPDESWH